jgi:hypothetical protein
MVGEIVAQRVVGEYARWGKTMGKMNRWSEGARRVDEAIALLREMWIRLCSRSEWACSPIVSPFQSALYFAHPRTWTHASREVQHDIITRYVTSINGELHLFLLLPITLIISMRSGLL